MAEAAQTFFTVKQLSKRWQVTPLTVYKWIRDGTLKGTKLGCAKNAPVRVHRRDMLTLERGPARATPPVHPRPNWAKRERPKRIMRRAPLNTEGV